MAGYTLTNICRLLWQNRLRVHPKYWLRLSYALAVSTLLLPLRIWEDLTFARRIERTVPPKDPIFILGFYRSGTTFLHTLFSKDPNRGCVSNVEAYLPATFLGSPRITRWLVSVSLPDQRPMDAVFMRPDTPAEEEYAIGAYEKYSIYNGFIFPQNFALYSRYNAFAGMPSDLARWKRRWSWFYKKMTITRGGKQMVYKNPTATYRIRHLLDMYPGAKFVHIYRNPYNVFSSSMAFHDEVFKIYALQTWDRAVMQETILENYREMYDRFARDKDLIPEGSLAEVKYEDFIERPMRHMERIYATLRLAGYGRARSFLRAYADSQRDYEPNKHVLSAASIRKVNAYWGQMIDRFGYRRLDPSAAPCCASAG